MASRPHPERHNIRMEDSPAMVEELQSEYRKELARRFRKLRGVIRTTISENDALEIGDASRRNADESDSGPNIEARDDFEFDRVGGKKQAFLNQLQEWLDEGILERTGEDAVKRGDHYSGIYAEAAYEQGLDFGADQLIERGIETLESGEKLAEQEAKELMGRPVHISTLEQIYTRNYQGLKDITSAIDSQVSEILTKGLRDGWNPRKMADEINREIREIERTRGRVLARTETMNAHNTAALKRYEGSGVSQVEILTHSPCQVCEEIEDQDPYPAEVGMGIVPAHPNCVCTYAPVV